MHFKKVTMLGATGVLAITLSAAGFAYAAPVPYNNQTTSSTVNAVAEKGGAKDRVERHQNRGAEFAGILGMDANVLGQELKSGKTLAQIAQDKGIAKDTLISGLQSIMKANLDQAVKDNKITADKATQIESKLPQMIERMVTRVHKD